jgi:hypothetical protein
VRDRGLKLVKARALTFEVGQPFLRKLLFEVQAETGLPAGNTVPLPRTPEMYEERTSWRYEEQTSWRLDLDVEAMGGRRWL